MAESRFLLNIIVFAIIFFIYSSFNLATASRLNVPRILLPVSNNFSVNFTLEVTEGGCYQWSSSSLDVIHLTPMKRNAKHTCSSEVLIQTVVKDPAKNTAIVLAEDMNTGKFLRCDVIVDAIHSLQMVTTTRELFVEEAPEAFEVRAYDERGNEFTTLAGIEFEWTIGNKERHIINNDIVNENDILRFVKFKASRYETPSTISMLDEINKFGSIILLEGVKTGTSYVSARLPYSEFKHVPSVEVELIVTVNLILLPSDVIIMEHDSVVYKIMQVHQGRLEQIQLPSNQYYLSAEQSDILEIDKSEIGKAYALKNGRSQVQLHSKNVNEDCGIVLPTASVHVNDVDHIKITVLPNKNYGLILGQNHEITVELFDEKDQKFYIGDGVEIKINIDPKFFETKSITQNGSHVIGVPITYGTTIVEAHLHGIITKYGKKKSLLVPFYAKTELIIHTPVVVSPRILAVPWGPISTTKLQFALKANGGDGIYSWTSQHPERATVDQNGLVSVLDHGTTNIIVSMAKNLYNRDITILHVMFPTRLEIIHNRLDAAIGEIFYLNIALYGQFSNSRSSISKNKISFTDCHYSLFEVSISNKNFVQNSSALSTANGQPIGNACTTLAIAATGLGSSVITVIYNVNDHYKLMHNITLSVYEPLIPIHPESGETLLVVGSSRNIIFKGGPQTQNNYGETKQLYQHEITMSDEEIVKIVELHNESPDIYAFEVLCLALGNVIVKFSTTKQSEMQSCQSSSATANVKIICGKPRHIYLYPEYKDSVNCPIAKNADRIMAHYQKPLNLIVTVQDENNREFDNITSLSIEWTLKPADSRILQTTSGVLEETFIDYNIVLPKNHHQIIYPKNHIGTLTLLSQITDYQKPILAKLNIIPEWPPFPIITEKGRLSTPMISAGKKLVLVNDTTIVPNTISILNVPNSQHSLQVSQGSGYYEFIQSTTDIADLRYIESTKTISVIPKKSGILQLALIDLCFVSDPAVAEIQVQQLANIVIESIDKVEKRKCITAAIKLFDTNGNLIKLPSIEAFDLRIKVDNSFVEIQPLTTSELKNHIYNNGFYSEILYVIHGKEEGRSKIIATNGYNEHEIRSESLEIQVFSPLKMNKKNVTLLIGSIYQVLTIGGPSNDVEIEFHVSNDKNVQKDIVTSINGKDIFIGTSIGQTSIISIAVGQDNKGQRVVFSQNQMDITVTELEGIRIITPTSRIIVGAKIPFWAFGIPDSLDPLIIGSINSRALLNFSWMSSDSSILSLYNMYDGTRINPRYHSDVTIRGKAIKPGTVTVFLNVTKSYNDYRDVTFSTSIEIKVIDKLILVTPETKHQLSTILMTPNSSLKLVTTQDSQLGISYKTFLADESTDSDGFNALATKHAVTVDKTGTIKTGDNSGRTILSITNNESYNLKQFLTIIVDVKPIHYMMFSLDSDIKMINDEQLNALPKGLEFDYKVEFFDNLGNKFHATDMKTKMLPNRADLISIHDIPDNNKMTVNFNENGKLIAKIFSEKYPNQIFDYGYMVIGDSTFPVKTIMTTVGDVVCFSIPLITSNYTQKHGSWQSLKPQIFEIDGATGIGIARKPGQTLVMHRTSSSSDRKVEIKAVVQPISKITLILLRGKNITGVEVFHVPLILRNEYEGIKENNVLSRSLEGCRTQSSFMIESIPFACNIQFTLSVMDSSIDINDIFMTKPRFDIVTGFYYCDIIPIGSSTRLSSTLETKVQINAHSGAVKSKPLEIPYIPPVHIASKDIVFYQSIDDTVFSETLDVYGLTYVLSWVRLNVPDGIVINSKKFLGSNQLQFKLKLINDHDYQPGQYLIVNSQFTNQNISLLIRKSNKSDFGASSDVHWICCIYYYRFHFMILMVVIIIMIIVIQYIRENKINSVNCHIKNRNVFADKYPPPLQKSFNMTAPNLNASSTPQIDPSSPFNTYLYYKSSR